MQGRRNVILEQKVAQGSAVARPLPIPRDAACWGSLKMRHLQQAVGPFAFFQAEQPCMVQSHLARQAVATELSGC